MSLAGLRPAALGVDPVFLIRQEPNSEIFLSDPRKLFKRAYIL